MPQSILRENPLLTIRNPRRIGADPDIIDVREGNFVDINFTGTINGITPQSMISSDGVQTIKNKSLDDTTVNFVDSTDPTIKMIFNAKGVTNTSTIVEGSQTINRVITLPDANTTLVGRDTTDTLTNKTLTTPTISSILNGGTITLPTSTDTLVGRNTTDTLTNKTL